MNKYVKITILLSCSLIGSGLCAMERAAQSNDAATSSKATTIDAQRAAQLAALMALRGKLPADPVVLKAFLEKNPALAAKMRAAGLLPK